MADDTGNTDESDARFREIGDELYSSAPGAFTATRDTRIAEAKNAGDRGLATKLATLKRPSAAGWLVNLVALRRPDLVNDLLELGRTISQSQGQVSPHQLRDLSAQRRRQLDTILAQARALAAEAGEPPPSRQSLNDVESTFSAAMADDTAAAQVRSGRVLKSLTYSGFGSFTAGPGLAATPTGRPSKSTVEPPDSADEQRAAEERKAQAEARVAEARQVLDDAVQEEQANDRDAAALAEQIAALKDRLDQVHRIGRGARQRRIQAEKDLATAQRRRDRLG